MPSVSFFSNLYEDYCFEKRNQNKFNTEFFLKDSSMPFQNGKDKYILQLLEKIFSPGVRIEESCWKEILLKINLLLVEDGFILFDDGKTSGRKKFKYKTIKEYLSIPESIKEIAFSFDSIYINQQRELIENTFENKPYVSIGKSKEFIESALKYILVNEDVSFNNSDDLLKLNKKVTKLLKIDVNNNPEATENIKGVKQIFSGLTSIVQGMCELRNQNGDGHGHHPNYFPLPPRYARLAGDASITYVAFLKETYEEKNNNTK